MSARFRKESVIRASAAAVFSFHEAPDALASLQPPWMKVEIVRPPSSLAVGTRVLLKAYFGPLWQTIEAEHVAYEPGRMFKDRMVRGPFAKWEHTHLVEPRGAHECLLIDSIEYDLPFGGLGRACGGWLAKRELERLFAFRHRITRQRCEP